MNNPIIAVSTFSFLKELSKNNNRDWFNIHKAQYQEALLNMASWIDQLILEMNKHDVIENSSGKKSLYRIYNDVRFSKDKSPYNPRFAFSLSRTTQLRRGGYYVCIKPGKSYLACGFFGPNSEDLLRIRQDIDFNYEEWHALLKSKKIKENFIELKGEKLVTAPRGFAKDHKAIELLRQKQFILRHEFSDKDVLSVDFLKNVNAIFKSVRPFFDYMSEVLTTDLNGELVVP